MTVAPLTETRAIPLGLTVPVVLATTVVLSTVLHALLALRSPSPWIVPDEIIYSELAKSMAEGGPPAIRDEVSFAYGLGYPALLAPVWAIFEDVPTAYVVAKVLNAFVLSFTAVPAYFLARRFVLETTALLIAALSIAVPSMLYAGTLMTEVALYPAFVLALLAMTAALERSTLRTQMGAVGAIAVASAIKMSAAVLFLAYAAAIVVYHWLDTRERLIWHMRLRAYWPTWIVLVAGLAGVIALAVALGRSPVDALGAYAVVLANIDLSALPWWALLHLAELDLYVAVIPFAATLGVIWRGIHVAANDRERLFVALTLTTCTAVIGVVAAFASTSSPAGTDYPENVARLHERGIFFLAPLFFIGLAMTISAPVLPRRNLLVTGIVAGCLPALIPLDRFVELAYFQAMALFPWIENRHTLPWPLGYLVLAGALATLYVVRARIKLIVVAIVLLFATTTLSAHHGMESASSWARDQAWGPTAGSGWIDAAVGARTVSVLWAEPTIRDFAQIVPRHRIVWQGEFFNRSVTRVYELGPPMPYGLPATRVRLEGRRVVLLNGRAAPLGEFVLVPCYVRVAGVPIARDPSTGAAVVRVSHPVRATVLEPGSCPSNGAS